MDAFSHVVVYRQTCEVCEEHLKTLADEDPWGAELGRQILVSCASRRNRHPREQPLHPAPQAHQKVCRPSSRATSSPRRCPSTSTSRARSATSSTSARTRALARTDPLARPQDAVHEDGVPRALPGPDMTAIHTIVTHPGGAHKDDLLAVLVAENPSRDPAARPGPAELADPAVAVVDVGGSRDPARSNFDHHQFPRHAPTCALSLVLDGLGLYQDALRFCDWLETTGGSIPRAEAYGQWLGAPREAVAQLPSPVDMTLLRRFADAPEHRPGELVHGWMNAVGTDLVQYTARAGVERIDSACERWSVEAPGTVVETVFLARDAIQLDEPSASLGRYVRWKASPTRPAPSCIRIAGATVTASPATRTTRAWTSPASPTKTTCASPASGFMCKTSLSAATARLIASPRPPRTEQVAPPEREGPRPAMPDEPLVSTTEARRYFAAAR